LYDKNTRKFYTNLPRPSSGQICYDNLDEIIGLSTNQRLYKTRLAENYISQKNASLKKRIGEVEHHPKKRMAKIEHRQKSASSKTRAAKILPTLKNEQRQKLDSLKITYR